MVGAVGIVCVGAGERDGCGVLGLFAERGEGGLGG